MEFGFQIHRAGSVRKGRIHVGFRAMIIPTVLVFMDQMKIILVAILGDVTPLMIALVRRIVIVLIVV